MSRREKVAVSIDAELLERVERLRAITGESRSAFVNRALVVLTAAEARAARTRRYVEAYRARPESAGDVDVARAVARRTLARLAWDDPA
jgi:metal-responsive CopG/Arc/MetJ family transcriptional regulator